MSQSHTGRNGLIEESIQTKKQRTAFEATMEPSGQNTNLLKNIFSGSPVLMDTAGRKSAFTSGGNDRAKYFTSSDSPYENFKALRTKDVVSGFGFEDTTISMTYASSLSIDKNGIASVQSDKPDLYDSNNREGLEGHPNLKVSGFSALRHDSNNSTQVDRNEDLPGIDVDASTTRLDNISQYFNGSGNRQ